jgi:hypothetical protein
MTAEKTISCGATWNGIRICSKICRRPRVIGASFEAIFEAIVGMRRYLGELEMETIFLLYCYKRPTEQKHVTSMEC